jgi:hypothetical protein
MKEGAEVDDQGGVAAKQGVLNDVLDEFAFADT